MSDLVIRKATYEDAEGKGYVHYRSWIETYTGIFLMTSWKRLVWSEALSKQKHILKTLMLLL